MMSSNCPFTIIHTVFTVKYFYTHIGLFPFCYSYCACFAFVSGIRRKGFFLLQPYLALLISCNATLINFFALLHHIAVTLLTIFSNTVYRYP